MADYTMTRIPDGNTAENILLKSDGRVDTHNGNFLSPINQHNIVSGTTYNTANMMLLDRWKLISGSFVWTEKTGGALNGVVKQSIEALPEFLYSKPFPYKISIGGTEYRGVLDFPATNTGAAATVTVNGVTIEIGFESYSAILCGISSAYTPYVKLTTSVSTTINYFNPPADFGIAELDCQRYALNLPNVYASGYTYTSTSAYVFIPTPNKMRILPTAVISNYGILSCNGADYTPTVITPVVLCSNGIIVGVTCSGLPTKYTCTLHDVNMLLSADL